MAAAVVALGIALAACGSGSASPGVASIGSSPSGNSGSGSSGLNSTGNSGSSGPQGGTMSMSGVSLRFSECMQTHGEPSFPDPDSSGQITVSGVNPSSPEYERAQRECAKYAPNKGQPPSPAQQAKMLANALKYSQCMRSHGITDFPDPTSGPNGQGVAISIKASPGSNLNPNNPQFQAAQRKCQGIMGGGAMKIGAAPAGKR